MDLGWYRMCKWVGFIGNEGRDDPDNVMFMAMLYSCIAAAISM